MDQNSSYTLCKSAEDPREPFITKPGLHYIVNDKILIFCTNIQIDSLKFTDFLYIFLHSVSHNRSLSMMNITDLICRIGDYILFFLHQWIPKLNVILSLTITSKHFHCSPADGSYSVWSGWIEMQSRQKGRVQSQSAGRCASLVERWSSGGDTLLYRNCITQMHEQMKSVWSKDFFPNVSTFSYLTQGLKGLQKTLLGFCASCG